MNGPGRLTDTLVRTLVAKAAQETVPEVPPFDPTRRPIEPLDIPEASGRRLVPAAAAVFLVVALVGGAVAWVTRGEQESDDTRTVADDPDGWLRPTWVPEGMAIWDTDWSVVSDADDPLGDGWSNRQLFGDPDAGRALYLRYGPQGSDEIRARGPVTVRGVEGTVGSVADDPDGPSVIAWTENGVPITARFKGMSAAEATSALSGLRWRSGRPADGFAPPGDGSLPLQGESLSAHHKSSRTAGFVYGADIPGTGVRSLSIMTSTGGGMRSGYLDRWFDGDAEPARADGSRRLFDPENSLMHAYWADGREVWISFRGLDRATLERVVDSMVLDPESDLVSLQDEFPANLTELPVLAAADTPIGRIELHGAGHYSRLCLRRPGAAVVDCGVHPNSTLARPDDTTLTIPGSWLIDGRWYVGVASQDSASEIYGDRGVDVTDDVLPSAVSFAGEWRLLFVEPPPDVQEITTTMHDLDGFTTIARPT